METLIIGQIDVLSQPFLDQLSRQTDLVLSADRPVSNFTGTKIKQYTHAVQDDSFLNLFSAYSFDAVLFFVGRPESQSNDSSEIEDLERVLNACAQKPIKKVIVVSSTYVYKKMESASEEEEIFASNGADIRLSAMEELCRTYRETYHVPVTILRTACLYGEGETASYVGDSIKKLVEEDEIVLDGRPDQVVGFLSLRDLATLIERILLEPQKTIPVMNVPGFTRLSLQQFADLLKKKKLGVSIRFTGRALGAGPPVQLQKAFAEYRWEPEVDLLQEMDNLVDRISSSHSSTQRSFFDRAKDFYRTHSTILIGLELIVGFFLMEYMIDFSATTVQFRVIDFRLLFVVLFAAAHGPQLGLLSALIASLSVYTSYMAMGVDWRIIFYNVDNWIPFAVYFITAWIIGYVHDRYRREVEDTQEEIADLSRQHEFLNDLYLRALERKSGYEKQIISYQDSFGKVYQFDKRLEQAAPSTYFQEALRAVEDFLDNQTISFYVFTEASPDAYRYVYSSKAEKVSPEWLRMADYPEFAKRLTAGEVWVNKNQMKGYPDYAIPLFKEGNLVVLITIHEAEFDQMSMSFENLFKITGHFVSTSLLHKLQAHKEEMTAPLIQTIENALNEERKSHREKETVKPRKEPTLHLVASQQTKEND